MGQQFPPDFVSYVEQDAHLGTNLLEALNTVSPVSIRKNPGKHAPVLQGEQAIQWCNNAFFLNERPVFTLNPLFHAGTFYPQEAGSMLLDYILRSIELPEQPIALDLCAAPGGKSTLITSFLNGNGLLIANEVINQRAKILKENVSKWGYANTIVTNNDPSDFARLTALFDLIVVDAPCSGEGMFRKDEQARGEWSLENVNLCAGRQKRIVADVWDSLREGGYLIYSTCTFNPHENEENIRWIEENLGAEYIHIDAPFDFVQGRNETGIYGIPGRTQTEGFFIAVLRKTGEREKTVTLGKNANKGLVKLKDTSFIKSWLSIERTEFFNWNETVLAIPAEWEKEYRIIQDNLHIIKWGIVVGENARKGLIPDHDLLMCHALRADYPEIELEEQQALYYLHGDTFSLTGAAPNGFVQVKFQNESLGWIKNIGNRFNNLYPKEYRIRMRVD